MSLKVILQTLQKRVRWLQMGLNRTRILGHHRQDRKAMQEIDKELRDRI